MPTYMGLVRKVPLNFCHSDGFAVTSNGPAASDKKAHWQDKSGQIPAITANTIEKSLMRLHILIAFLALLGTFAGVGSAQAVADFYDPGTIQDLYLDVHPSDWAKLRENVQDNTYYPAQFRWRDITLPDVGIRQRGRSSRSPIKPNLRIDFDRFEEKQKFLGLKSTVLKANNADASMMKERISMILFDRLGIPTPREAFARLYINGEFFGFFNLIESIDKDFLQRVYNEDAGYLYEWKPKDRGYHFEFLGDDPAAYSPLMFDPVTHEKDPDPQPIVDMVRAINQSSDAEFIDVVSRYIDAKQFLKHVAAEHIWRSLTVWWGNRRE